MDFRARFLFSYGLPALLCLLLPGGLRAQTTWTYTGTPYPYCSGTFVCNGTTPALTITFQSTLSLAAAARVSGDITSTVTSWSVTDHSQVNFTPSFANAQFLVNVWTDSTGYPSDWTVEAVGESAAGNYETACTTTFATIGGFVGAYSPPSLPACNGVLLGDYSWFFNPVSFAAYGIAGYGGVTFNFPYSQPRGRWVIAANTVSASAPETITATDTAFVAVTPSPVPNAAPLAYFSAGNLGFGGQTGTQPLAVSNLGQANLSLAASPPAAPFSISQTFCPGGVSSLPTTLPPGGTCFFSIAYAAPPSGAPAGAITFTDNAGLSNLTSTSSGSSFTQSVPLSAAGGSTGPPSLPPTSVSVSVNEAITAIDTDTASVPPVSTAVTLATIPIGLLVSVDGGTPQVAPATFTLSSGFHTIAVATTQSLSPGTQFVFANWSDSGAATHPIVVGSSPATFTAAFQRYYLLTTAASPAAGGTVTPVGGTFRIAGAVVSVQATAAAGYQFANFSGGALSGSTNPQSVTMNGPANVVANFTPLAPNLAASVGSRTPTGSFVLVGLTLTNTGLGTATNATITSITGITDVAGTGTVSAPSSTLNLGAIPPGASATGAITFVWPSTATRVSFTVNFTADGGYSGSTRITVLY